MIVLRATKLPGETAPLSWDFTAELVAEELVATAVVTATNLKTGLAAPGILVGGATPATPLVTQKVTGGVIGDIYRVDCAATSDASLVYHAATELHIIGE